MSDLIQVIVNADDLGYASDVNKSIFELIDRGKVTSATLMANAPAVESAAQELKRYPQASFGAHLNLTEFAPLAPTSGLEQLLDARGNFNANIRKVRSDGRMRNAIFVEWSAQIERLRALGVNVTHLDSHHHVHTIPSLFPVLKRLQSQYGLRKVRLTRNLFDVGERLRPGLRPAKGIWNAALRHIYTTKTTARFTKFETFYSQLRHGHVPGGVIELMVHPGNSSFDDETRLLQGSWTENARPRIELVSYHDI